MTDLIVGPRVNALRITAMESVRHDATATEPRGPRPLLDPPGGLLLWIVVALELLAFAVIFVAVAHLRRTQGAVFRAGQAALDARGGVALTVVLVTSGWLAAEGVHAFRASRFERARAYHAGAVGAGVAFVLLKAADYASKARAGFGLGVDDFWDYYLLATGFHFAHVLVGLTLLGYVGARMGRARFEDPETAVAGTALFWHMCDLAWFFLYPLFYARG